MSYRVKLVVSYDGTDFCGWQKQNRSQKPSVQELLETSLGQLLKQEVHCFGSGRTDAGVHAVHQVAHFDCEQDPSKINFTMAMKSRLPSSVSIRSAKTVSKDFHANFSARAKTYRYVLYTGKTPSPLLARYSWWYPHRFDIVRLNQVAEIIKGTHDFKSFQSRGTQLLTTVRTIYSAKWSQPVENIIRFEITGSGFLKQMVRNLVGTQMMFCKDKTDPKVMADILEQRDRSAASMSAPPQGLFLMKVYYPSKLDKPGLQL